MFKRFISSRKHSLIVWITCVFWIFSKCFSYKLWHSARVFPLSPPFDFLENIPQEIHLFLFFISLIGIGLTALFQNKWILGITIIVDICSCLLDQNRWHPVEYQCLFTAISLFFYRNDRKQFLNCIAFLFCAIYIFSGLHKLNGGFLYHVWDKMILRRFFRFEAHEIQSAWIHYSGLLLGLTEMACGLGLLFFKNKKAFLLTLVGMHIFILLLISPTGLNYNQNVWPWNIAMVLIILVLFGGQNPVQVSLADLVPGYNKLVLFFLGVLPLLGFLGFYDKYMSFSLYSGNLKQLDICLQNKIAAQLYTPYFSDRRTCCEMKDVINVNLWAQRELNATVYPEERVYFDIIKKFKAKNPGAQATFCIYQYPYKPENIAHYK